MDPTPFLIVGGLMGTLFGASATLSIQWFANRKVKKALKAQAAPVGPSPELLHQQRETAEMRKRLAVLEAIVTDQPKRLAHEIEGLR
ncbi:hypothetical protein [Sphingomonas pruni]|uniref:hypothetical protein n=1 Tax=Sphingomonas pruni TaxID=40683 RepID=UPI000AB4DB71|nr:hypothetical protein [Sphingomonas pruni]